MPLPPLPSLPPNWQTRVFTPPATAQERPQPEGEEAIPDAERLAFIGNAILHLGVTEWLHEHFPKTGRSDLNAQKDKILSDKPTAWANLYKLSSQLRITTASESPNQGMISKGDLFRAYAGAVHLNGQGDHEGNNVATGWIKGLIDCHEADSSSTDENENCSAKADKNSMKQGGDELSGMLGALVEPQSEALKPRKAQPPPASVNIQTANPSNPVSLLNEKAMQQRVELLWKDDSSGPDHLKQWQSTLIVKDREFSGTGLNKKLSRCAAAEVALRALKWGVGSKRGGACVNNL